MPQIRPLRNPRNYDRLKEVFAIQGLFPSMNSCIDAILIHDREFHCQLTETTDGNFIEESHYRGRFYNMIANAIGCPNGWPMSTASIETIRDFQKKLNETLPGLGWTIQDPI